MYYRRQGEPQEMYGNNSVSSSAVNTYQPYYLRPCFVRFTKIYYLCHCCCYSFVTVLALV